MSGGRDATIRVWDLDVKCCRRTLPGHTADVLHLAALIPHAPDADSASTAPAGAQHKEDGGPTGLPAPNAFSTEDAQPRVLSSCSADGTCRLWDVRTWTCVKIISPSLGVLPPPPVLFTLTCGCKQLLFLHSCHGNHMV